MEKPTVESGSAVAMLEDSLLQPEAGQYGWVILK